VVLPRALNIWRSCALSTQHAACSSCRTVGYASRFACLLPAALAHLACVRRTLVLPPSSARQHLHLDGRTGMPGQTPGRGENISCWPLPLRCARRRTARHAFAVPSARRRRFASPATAFVAKASRSAAYAASGALALPRVRHACGAAAAMRQRQRLCASRRHGFIFSRGIYLCVRARLHIFRIFAFGAYAYLITFCCARFAKTDQGRIGDASTSLRILVAKRLAGDLAASPRKRAARGVLPRLRRHLCCTAGC